MLGFLTDAERTLGPVVPFRMVGRRWVLLSDAPAIHEVLLDRDGVFEKPDAIYGPGRLIFGNSLTGLKGEVWRRRRAVVAPAFHRQPLAGSQVVSATQRWARGVAEGGRVRIDAALQELMIEVAGSNLLGSDATGSQRLAPAVSGALLGMNRRMRLALPVPDWLPLPAVRQMRRGSGEVKRFVDAVIARRLRTGEFGHDLLGDLMTQATAPGAPIDMRAARDEVAVSTVVGGHQMAVALSWTLHLLSRYPAQQARLVDELDAVLGHRPPTPEDVGQLELARSVLEESMRLYPPFYMIGRQASRDTAVAGHRLPGGTTILLSAWVTHRLERYFADPAEFRPSRWQDGLAQRLPRGAYFPTGGGGRLCVANASMRKEILLVLASLLQTHEFVADTTDVSPHAATSLTIRGGLWGRLRRRAAPGVARAG